MILTVIGGATATGKSKLAVEVAKILHGEVISADSMQIYRKMDIGTAKITKKEMDGVVHHMIDIVDPNCSYSVAQYTDAVKSIIKEKEKTNTPLIICGGTGLYINSLIYEYKMSAFNDELRKELMQELYDNGIDYMYEKLLKLDPLAVNIHKNNVKRVIRALEVIISEGKSILDKDDKKTTAPHLMYAIDKDRAQLYNDIDLRVDLMFNQGLINEVKYLLDECHLDFNMQSMQAIGYKEFKDYFYGQINEESLKDLIKQHSRNYAKRQNTWFKRIDSCNWVNNDNIEALSDRICNEYYEYMSKIE